MVLQFRKATLYTCDPIFQFRFAHHIYCLGGLEKRYRLRYSSGTSKRGSAARPYSSCSSHGYVLLKNDYLFTNASAGYYNILLAYGEEKAIQDAYEAGANGFMMADLPPEEAVAFREKCRTAK